jgi:hypothetical protein
LLELVEIKNFIFFIVEKKNQKKKSCYSGNVRERRRGSGEHECCAR